MNYGGEIVFFTGTIDYAVNGYDYEALAYLIKGKTSSERFSEVIRHFLIRKGERSGEVIILRCAGETREMCIRDRLYSRRTIPICPSLLGRYVSLLA